MYSSSGGCIARGVSLPLHHARGRSKSAYFGSFLQGIDVFARTEEAQSGWRRGQQSTLMTKRSAEKVVKG